MKKVLIILLFLNYLSYSHPMENQGSTLIEMGTIKSLNRNFYFEQEKERLLFDRFKILVKDNNSKKLRAFIKLFNFDLNIKDEKTTPLHFAAQYAKNPKILTMLIKRGASVTIKDNKNSSPLILAIKMNQPEKIITVLIKHEPNPNQFIEIFQDTLLGKFVSQDSKLVKIILNCGANPDIKRINGETYLQWCIEKKFNRSLGYLLKAGALPNERNNEGTTALMVAALEYPEIIPTLIEHGADPSLKNYHGKTALYYLNEAHHSDYTVNKYRHYLQL